MLVDITPIVDAKIILASSSPRRVEILNTILCIGATVVPSTFPEDLDKSAYSPADYVAENARRKADEVATRLRSAGEAPGCVIGADTVVVHRGRILEKPADAAEAEAMLSALSASEHEVCTGVALIYATGATRTFVETTRVDFAHIPPAAIAAYVASGEPFDKAGGYGIQGLGGAFVSGIRGCYYNVVGFPMHRFCAEFDLDAAR